MKQLTIPRSKWARVEGEENVNGDSRLLNVDGGMCCLGFYGKHISGKSDEYLLGKGNLFNVGEMVFDVYRNGGSCLQDRMIAINDNYGCRGLTISDREQYIIAGFKLIGVECEFTDE